jgi:hypothetical protein
MTAGGLAPLGVRAGLVGEAAGKCDNPPAGISIREGRTVFRRYRPKRRMRSALMRLGGAVVAAGLLTACGGGLAERQAELTHWVGQPESQLLAAMGTPRRAYESGRTKFLTYQEIHVEQEPSGPFYFGPGPAAPTGFSGPSLVTFCDTTFAIVSGVVQGFNLQGNGCR